MPMKINAEGFGLIKRWEGLVLDAYLCPAGVWTIGYGHTKTARKGMSVTPHEAKELLLQDVAGFEAAVERHVVVPLNSNEFSALVSMAFNIGEKNFKKSSCLRFLNAGDRHEATN